MNRRYGTGLRSVGSIWHIANIARRDAPLLASVTRGERHWHDVAHLGLQLAKADQRVSPFTVVLFALYHDCRRQREGDDPDHGQRGANALRSVFENTALPVAIEDAVAACELHETDHVECDDPTIAACLDADRLLAPRFGHAIDPTMLTTSAARDHALGHARLMMPEPNEPLGWGQRWIVANRMRASPRPCAG